jgi:hypothetical protein
MIRKYTIYHLIDPESGLVRYVGMSQNPRNRLVAHIAESKITQNTEKKAWIHGLLRKNKAPILGIVSSYDTEERARIAESEECSRHIKTIFNLHDPRKGAKDIRKQKKGVRNG